MQNPQLFRQFIADYIGAGRKHLTEFDIGRTQRRQGAGGGRHVRIALVSQPLKWLTQSVGDKAQGGRGLERVQHHVHGACTL